MMHRTPPRHEIMDQVGPLSYPSAKVASITRKINEIKSSMSELTTDNLENVKELYCEFDERVQSWVNSYLQVKTLAESEGYSLEYVKDLEEKYAKHNSTVEEFRTMVSEWISECEKTVSCGNKLNENVSPQDSVSAISSKIASSVSSNKSSTSYIRERLAEEMAKLKAEQIYAEERKVIEEQERILRENKAKMEIRKHELLVQKLEEEMGKLETQSKHKPKSRKEGKRSIIGTDSVKLPQGRENPPQDSLALLLKAHERAALPKNEPEIFDGRDITRFEAFMQSFKSLIESRCDNYVDKLYYLEKYTKDDAQKLVASCRCKNPAEGYNKALNILEKEYGNEILVAQIHLKKIENWPIIKNEDKKALREFAIYLTSCSSTMSGNANMNILDSLGIIRKIMDKLPFKLRDKWRSEVLRMEELRQSYGFKHLAEFVQRQSNLWNHPFFGSISDEKREIKPLRKFAFTASTQRTPETNMNTQNTCLVCKKKNHSIQSCFFFKNKQYEEKRKFIKERGLCYACLSSNHMIKNCTNKPTCEICKRSHYTIMHKKNEVPNKTEPNQESKGNEETNISCIVKTVYASEREVKGKIVCPSVPVQIKLKGNGKLIETYAGLDSFSTDCYMSQSLLREMGVDVFGDTDMSISTMGKNRTNIKIQVLKDLEIYDLANNLVDVIPEVFCKKEWPFEKKHSPKLEDIQGQEHLSEIPIRFLDKEIGLLIGLNRPELVKPLGMVDGPPDSIYATLHRLGWALNGKILYEDREVEASMDSGCHFLRRVEDKIELLYSQEFIGEDSRKEKSMEDNEWEEIVKKSIHKTEDNHYELDLPFKSKGVLLPYNKSQAEGRLASLTKRLKSDDAFCFEYCDYMQMMIDKKYVEEVPQSELDISPGKVWYLTHFGVRHKIKKKLRVVFDCSLKYSGVSLNDQLLPGPDLLSNLLGVLLRFRENNVGIMADIEKMFLQIKVTSKHRNFLRFLWYPEGNMKVPPKQYRATVHIFGAVSSPACANYILKYIATENAINMKPETLNSILKNFYVDDLVCSLKTNEDALKVLDETTKLLYGSGFNLTNYVSNSIEVMHAMPLEKLDKRITAKGLLDKNLPFERALGVVWDIGKDTLRFSIKCPLQPPTKRGILSTIFSVYDPLGLASPVILPGKRIFQSVCHLGLKWDDPIPEKLRISWEAWRNDITKLVDFEVPRCIGSQTLQANQNIELHLFSDGSEVAYAALAYIRQENENGEFKVKLLMSKSHLVPLNKSLTRTIPQIELALKLYLIIKKKKRWRQCQPLADPFWKRRKRYTIPISKIILLKTCSELY